MDRIREIIDCVRSRYPEDDFFSNFEESCRNLPTKQIYYEKYNNALMVLDNESWQILKEKALRHFLNHRLGQRKQGFFNILNEAFAYQYLVNKGYKNIKFVEENGVQRRPDITFLFNNGIKFCEAKTINISESEIIRRANNANNIVVHDTEIIYGKLDDGFFNKFSYDVNKAREQLIDSGLIFIIIKFDDYTLDFYGNYRSKLINFIKDRQCHNLVIQIGITKEIEYLITGNDFGLESNI